MTPGNHHTHTHTLTRTHNSGGSTSTFTQYSSSQPLLTLSISHYRKINNKKTKCCITDEYSCNMIHVSINHHQDAEGTVSVCVGLTKEIEKTMIQ